MLHAGLLALSCISAVRAVPKVAIKKLVIVIEPADSFIVFTLMEVAIKHLSHLFLQDELSNYPS